MESCNYILIKAGIIVTMDPDNKIINDGWLLIKDDKIVNLGSDRLTDLPDNTKIMDLSSHVVMPGIVNIHTHVCGSLFRGLTEDNENGFYGLALPMEDLLTPESTYILSMLGCIETVKAGSTFINDIYHYMADTAKAVKEVGLRAQLAQKIIETNLGRIQFGDYTRIPSEGRKRLEENIELIETFHNKGDGTITCRFGPHATDTVSIELLGEICSLAEKYGVGIHTHAAQKTNEVEFVKGKYGLSPIQFLDKAGATGKKLVAAHCKFVDQNDIDILRDTKTNVAYCPAMHAKRGASAPLDEYFRKGVHVALGTDWVTMDPWDNMRAAIFTWRIKGASIKTINAQKVFRMSTIEAATNLGLESSIGSLEVGKKADIISIDMDRPHLQPIFDDVVTTIVYNANGNDVSNVIINGRVIVENGQLKTADEKAIVKEAKTVARSIYHNFKENKI